MNTNQETFDSVLATISIDGMCATGREYGLNEQGPTYNRIFVEALSDAMRAERNGSLESVMHHLRRCQRQIDREQVFLLAEMDKEAEATT